MRGLDPRNHLSSQNFEPGPTEREMQITPIKSQRDHKRVLKEIESLMRAKRNTPEGDRLDALVTLVEA
jgi:hypothetical protein